MNPMLIYGHSHGPYWQRANGLLVVILLLALSPTSADETPSVVNESSLPLDLRYEPIQPLPPPEGLDPRKVSLGERLFKETRFGRDNDMACVTCHDLSLNGANHLAHTPGRDGVELDVNTLTVFNSSLNHRLFWDGRAKTLEEQIDFVVREPREFATDWLTIIGKLKQDEDYVSAFKHLYADGITAANTRDAIATFQHSLITLNSRFDRYLLGDANAISTEEKAGYRLFKAYGCVACHQGRNVGGNMFMKFGVFKDYFAKRGNLTPADLGRFNVTGNERDRYVFRVPSLRLVALTAPYFHDGSTRTLEKAVRIMAEHQLGRVIPDQDIALIVAFLKTLPGEYQGRPLRIHQPGEEKKVP